jgi:hypothetical protein
MQVWATDQAPQRSNLEMTEDLLNHRLKTEDVGEMVGPSRSKPTVENFDLPMTNLFSDLGDV